jgi:hypothetical protein
MPTSRSLLPPLLLLLSACAEEVEETPLPDCSGHGEWSVDHAHCHCEDGYEMTPAGDDCVAAEDDTGGDDSGDDDTGETGDAGPEALDFAPDSTTAVITTVTEGRAWLLTGYDNRVLLNLELLESYGGPTAPGERALGAADTNYATCGACVLVQTGCDAHDDHYHCKRAFMPVEGGLLTLTALDDAPGGQISGALTDLVLQEVEIDAETYETTPVADGRQWALPSFVFDTTLSAPE